MASTTKEATHVELRSQETAEMDEMIKEAENSCLSEEILNKSRAMIAEYKDQNVTEVAGKLTPVIVLGGYLKSETQRPLTVFDSNLWAGQIVRDYPDPLDGSISVFANACITYDGIMAAVVYAGKKIAGVECGWLLAWADSDDKGKRVYADCGRKCKFECIDWEQIEDKLNKAVELASYVYDIETGTSVWAVFRGVDLPLDTQDTLTVIFRG